MLPMKAPFLIGRLLFGGFFLYNGINHLQNRKMMAPYAQSKGVPLPEAAVVASAIPLLVGGTSLLLGVKPKWGALAILAFLAGVSPVMHDFWRNEDPNERTNNMTNFAKNMALAGGALALLGVEEPWEASVPVAQPSFWQRVRRAGRQLAA
jgi:putative oxidoreductase